MISAEVVRELREKTGAGVMDCKSALTESDGNIEKAIEILRGKGLSKAAKKSGRIATEGLIASYIHTGGKIGVLVEVNCETDFVARTDEFHGLVKDIAMQIAATAPSWINREDIPEAMIEKEREIYRSQAMGSRKPEEVIRKIVEGKLDKFYRDNCLMEQPFIKDEEGNTTVQDIVAQKIAKLGENIIIRRFTRYLLGEGYRRIEI
ncbi:MAG: translation elongation factor Ts [Nitrospirota bacterium]